MSEIALDAVGFTGLEDYNGEAFFSSHLPCAEFHGKIFGQYRLHSQLSGTVTHKTHLGEIERKIAQIAHKPLKAGGSAEVSVDVSWGGKDGPTITITGSGEVHDDNGNYAKAEVSHDSDGEGNARVSAGHKDKDSD